MLQSSLQIQRSALMMGRHVHIISHLAEHTDRGSIKNTYKPYLEPATVA